MTFSKQFWVSDENGDSVPFSSGLIEAGHQLFLNGWVKDVTSESAESTGGVPVKEMGPITEWWFSGFDGSDGLIVGLETCYASYVLMDSHPSYSQVIQSIIDELFLCKLVIETLTSTPELTLTDLIEVISDRSNCRFSEDFLSGHSNFLIQQIANYDEAGTDEDMKILETQAMQDFMDFNVPSYVQKICVKHARRDSRRISNSDNFTVTTSLVHQFFAQIFDQTLENSFKKCAKETLCPTKPVIKKPKHINWSSDVIAHDETTGQAHYSEVTIDDEKFSIGDFLCFKTKDQPNHNFGQIKWMFETKNRKKFFHVLLLKSGSDTVLGSTSEPSFLFEVNKCQNIEVSSIIHKIIVETKPSIIKSMGQNICFHVQYFCGKRYDEKTGWFSDVSRTLFKPGNFCHVCQRVDDKMSITVNESSIVMNGMKHSVGDFVLLDPSSFEETDHLKELLAGKEPTIQNVEEEKYPEYFRKKLAPFGGVLSNCIRSYKVVRIEEVNQDGTQVRIKVRKLLRPWNVLKIFEEIIETDIDEVFWSKEIFAINPNQIVRKCSLIVGDRSDRFVFFMKRQVDECGILSNLDLTMNPVEKTGKTESKIAKLRGLDLFCGAGGLAKGFDDVVETRWAIERDDHACHSFQKNFPNCQVFQDDANKILEQILNGEKSFRKDKKLKLPIKGEVDIILAGPPCQGFSNMNRFSSRTYSLFKNSLIATTLSYVDHFRPKYVYIENVRNFFKFNKGLIFKLTLSCLIRMGYQVSFAVLQAGCYGIPQIRNRAFIIAALTGNPLPQLPPFITSFPGSQIKTSLLIDGKRFQLNLPMVAIHRPLTIFDAISDLPRLVAGDGEPIAYQCSPKTSFQQRMRRNGSDLLHDHVIRTPSELNQARMDRIPLQTGSDWRNLPNEEMVLNDGKNVKKLVYKYRDAESGKMRGVCSCSDGSSTCSGQIERQDMTLIPWCLSHTAHRNLQWTGLFGRLGWNEYFSTTVTIPEPISKQGRVIHPVEPRVISVREAARSQGFPDDFVFCGKIIDKYRQIGNAVPPPLAKALANQLEDAMRNSVQDEHP